MTSCLASDLSYSSLHAAPRHWLLSSASLLFSSLLCTALLPHSSLLLSSLPSSPLLLIPLLCLRRSRVVVVLCGCRVVLVLCACVVSWRCGGSRVLVVVLCGSLDLFFVVSNQAGKGTGPNGDPDLSPSAGRGKDPHQSSLMLSNVCVHFHHVVVHVVVHVRRVRPFHDLFFCFGGSNVVFSWGSKFYVAVNTHERSLFLFPTVSEFKILPRSEHASWIIERGLRLFLFLQTVNGFKILPASKHASKMIERGLRLILFLQR